MRILRIHLQISIDKPVNFAIHDGRNIAGFILGSVVLDQRVGHKNVRADLRSPFDIVFDPLKDIKFVKEISQLDLHELGL